MMRGTRMDRFALKGYWKDERTFVETVRNLAQLENVIFTYTFDGNRVTLDIVSGLGAYAFQLKGEMLDR